MVSLFCGNWGHYLPVESAAVAALRGYSNPVLITIPNYIPKTDRPVLGILDRHHYGTVIGISSEGRSPFFAIRSEVAKWILMFDTLGGVSRKLQFSAHCRNPPVNR
jgi:hypothetical protein